MRYDFLIETYDTERIKVISAWSMFTDQDLPVRPHPVDTRDAAFTSIWCINASAKTFGFGQCSILISERRRCQTRKSDWNSCGGTRKTAENAWPRCGIRMRRGGKGRRRFSTYGDRVPGC